MTRRACHAPIPWGDLVAYQLGELAPDAEERIEEHYFSCAGCTARLELVGLLGRDVAELVRTGGVGGGVTSELVTRAGELGVRLRSYSLAPGEEVACTAAPTDDFVVVRLAMKVEEGESVDLVSAIDFVGTGQKDSRRLEDVAVDRSAGEMVYLFPGELVRSFPRTRWTMEAHLRGPGGERRLGPYTLDHTPWEELPDN